jgi:hypothetical protein
MIGICLEVRGPLGRENGVDVDDVLILGASFGQSLPLTAARGSFRILS